MKTCNKCNNSKSLCLFYKDKYANDGLQAKCKSCLREMVTQHRNEHMDEYKAYSKKFVTNNYEHFITNIKLNQRKIEAGVYMIKNLINGKRYIGQSTAPNGRMFNHFSIMTKKEYSVTNKNLQADLKIYGRDAFIGGILEHCNKIDLLTRERFYINEFKPEYNIR
jgi:hypothetical protein